MLDEAVTTARTAGIAYSHGLVMLALTLPPDQSTRALALFEEAVEVGKRRGDRQGVANALAVCGQLAVQRGEWRTALHACVDAAELNLQLGAADARAPLRRRARACSAGLGDLEPAAVLIGFADAHFERFGAELGGTPSSIEELGRWLDASLVDGLGAQHVAELAARGAALDLADAVVYLRTHTDGAL